jgi:hypothetical protein
MKDNKNEQIAFHAFLSPSVLYNVVTRRTNQPVSVTTINNAYYSYTEFSTSWVGS